MNALLEALAQGPEDDSLVSLLPEDVMLTAFTFGSCVSVSVMQ